MFEGVLRKMKVELSDDVNYYLDFKNDFLHVCLCFSIVLKVHVDVSLLFNAFDVHVEFSWLRKY